MPSNSQQRRHSNLPFSPQCPAGLPAIEAVNQNPNNLNFYSLYLPRYPRPPPRNPLARPRGGLLLVLIPGLFVRFGKTLICLPLK